jgi:hypothetical protein
MTHKLNKERMITRGSGKLETAKQLKEIRQMNKNNNQKQGGGRQMEEGRGGSGTMLGGRQTGFQTQQGSAAC